MESRRFLRKLPALVQQGCRWFRRQDKGKDPEVLGLILPAALRDILGEVLWEQIQFEPSPWTNFARRVSGEPFPTSEDGNQVSKDQVQEWINNVLNVFCRKRARFVENILASEEDKA